MSTLTYNPDTVSPPGDTLHETLEALDMTQAQFAERTGLTTKTISHIITGKAPISEQTALIFERVLGTPARFWLNRESHYREFLARQAEEEGRQRDAEWARTFPYVRMADMKWVPPTSVAEEKAKNLLRFFAVNDRDCWKNVWAAPQACFRKTAKAPKMEVVSAWLRQGEIEARKMPVEKYDEAGFKEVVQSLRKQTVEGINDAVATIIHECAQVGVRYLTVPELPGLGVYGVTRWIADVPMIQQSLLMKSHDTFWFTFFHEAKHVMQKVKKRIFLEGRSLTEEDEKREEEANRFSSELLIPGEELDGFVGKGDFSTAGVRRFANEIGIDPGIVVGQMLWHHPDKIHYSSPVAGRLRRQIEWEPLDEKAS